MASQPQVSGAHYFRNIPQPAGNIESAKYFQLLLCIEAELAFESTDYRLHIDLLLKFQGLSMCGKYWGAAGVKPGPIHEIVNFSCLQLTFQNYHSRNFNYSASIRG
jgi:hypothetical protein